MNKQQGQTLIIILLIMAVSLTVGLSVVSRSTSDIKISQQEKEATRAFSIAELGIEQALIGGPLTGSTADGITYQVSTLSQGGTDTFNFAGGTFAAGETQTIWLVEHDSATGEIDPSNPNNFLYNSRINFCWGHPNSAEMPALEVILVYNKAGVFYSSRVGYDPDASRRATNFFKTAELASQNSACKIMGMKYSSYEPSMNGVRLNHGSLYTNVINSSTPYLLRLRLIYNSTPQPVGAFSKLVGGTVDRNFPGQGTCYESAATTASGVSRKVRQCQFFAAPPNIFDYALFSNDDLVK